jgi:hypothetical protein
MKGFPGIRFMYFSNTGIILVLILGKCKYYNSMEEYYL